MRGLVIGAPQSGSGKTVLTLALLRALTRQGVEIAPAKAGPDYIDPAFHAAAARYTSVNLDPWAMRRDFLSALSARATSGGRMLVVEGMMGLHDGAADGSGTTADLAAILGLPVVFVIDVRRMGHSVSALVQGFRDFRDDIQVPGVILNQVGSPRHETMLREALSTVGVDVLGAVPRDERLVLADRHLGLVQASEHDTLEAFLEGAADVAEKHCDLSQLVARTAMSQKRDIAAGVPRLPPPGQKVAVASDPAFTFSYAHMLDGWRRRGAEISFFSPLADESPADDCDAVFLPGGYPELHAERIADARNFKAGIKSAAGAGKPVYGECGGYMVLGETLTDSDGRTHEMLGLLGVQTSFATPRLHLGYRRITLGNAAKKGFGWPLPAVLRGHEFHYSSALKETGDPLFEVCDARGENLGRAGLVRGSVAGSYLHLIDMEDA